MLMLSEQPRLWRRVGWVARGPCRARVFEALAVVPCAHCGRSIQPGERFRLVVLPHKATIRLPVCRACLPVTGLVDS